MILAEDRADDPAPARAPLRALVRRMIGVAALIVLTMLAGALWLRWEMRSAQWEEAERIAQNLALGLEREIGNRIDGYDQALQAASRALALPGFDGLQPVLRDALLYDHVARAAHSGLAVVDAAGRPVLSFPPRDYGDVGFADRQWFIAHRERRDLGLFISQPLTGRTSGDRNIALSRRVDAADGSFAGAVVMSLRTESFSELFATLSLSQRTSVTLLTQTGRIVSRHPFTPTDFDRPVGDAEVLRLAAAAPNGVYEATSRVDGVRRLYAYRRVGTLPFLLVVGLAETDILAPWARTARMMGTVLLPMLLLSAVMGRLLAGELRRRDAAEAMMARHAEALERSEALLRTVLETTPSLVYAKDAEGRLLLANGRLLDSVSRSWAEVAGRDATALTEDADRARAAMAEERRIMQGGQPVTTEETRELADGTPRTLLSIRNPMLDAQGQPVGLVSVSLDITSRKQAETRQRLLIHELNHRVKNILAVVQALAQQTLRGAAPALLEALSSRLMAMAAAHDVLTRESWAGAGLADIVSAALAPFEPPGAARFAVGGPDMRLSPAASLSLSLALHELATNALKYGALSAPGGTVAIVWRIDAGADGDAAWRLEWIERGGPAVAPPQRLGFGTRLVERSLGQEFAGSARIDFTDPAGVRCVIEAKLSALMPHPDGVGRYTTP